MQLARVAAGRVVHRRTAALVHVPGVLGLGAGGYRGHGTYGGMGGAGVHRGEPRGHGDDEQESEHSPTTRDVWTHCGAPPCGRIRQRMRGNRALARLAQD